MDRNRAGSTCVHMIQYRSETRYSTCILCLRFDRGSASYEPWLKRGETRRNRGLNEAQPRSKRGTRCNGGLNEVQPRSKRGATAV